MFGEAIRRFVRGKHELMTLLPCFQSLIRWHEHERNVTVTGLRDRIVASSSEKRQRFRSFALLYDLYDLYDL